MNHQQRYRRIVVWMRRAYRIEDNGPLNAAVQDGGEVIPVVCLARGRRYHDHTPRRNFVREALVDLDHRLARKGSGLHVRVGDPEQEIVRAAKEYGAEAVYAARVYDPRQAERDVRLGQALGSAGVTFTLFKDHVLREGGEILTGSNSPFRVFTPYKRAWLSAAEDVPPPVPSPRALYSPGRAKGSCALGEIPGFHGVSPGGGESLALNRLRSFADQNLGRYRDVRDFPGIDGTSRLSPFLALGAISIRTVYWAARERGLNAGRNEREQIDTFISELIWREFYYQILANFPYVVHGAYREEFRDIPWSANEDHFRRWREGTTGYPIVDAAMRQLAAEGWMHNRTRMITASFLTKDLHLNWQWGEQVFAGQLIDADLASNNGGWQWTAGTGTDASPWFRIFNPVTQSRKFDPDGVYIRKYLPELRRVPAAAVHEPWTMTRSQQEAAGCIIGRDYPEPVVDHQQERQVTLAMYSQPVR